MKLPEFKTSDLVSRHFPDAPAELRPHFKRVQWSGNPPHAPYRYGWHWRRPDRGMDWRTYEAAKDWLRAHGFKYSGGRWCLPDFAP